MTKIKNDHTAIEADSGAVFLYVYNIIDVDLGEPTSMIYLLTPCCSCCDGDPIDYMREYHHEQYSKLLRDIGEQTIDVFSSVIELDNYITIGLANSFSGVLGKVLRYPLENDEMVWSIEQF